MNLVVIDRRTERRILIRGTCLKTDSDEHGRRKADEKTQAPAVIVTLGLRTLTTAERREVKAIKCEDLMLLFVTSCHGAPLRLKAEDCMCICRRVWQQLCTDLERSMIQSSDIISVC